MAWKIKTTKDRITTMPSNGNSTKVRAEFDIWKENDLIFTNLEVSGPPSSILQRMETEGRRKKAEYLEAENFNEVIEININSK